MENKPQITESLIIEHLNKRYKRNNVKYKLSNAYIFKNDWESDFFIQKQNDYCYEFEIKISRSDFFNDKKKVSKHSILSEGRYQTKHTFWAYDYEQHKQILVEEKIKEHVYNFMPNKFFYVVPENLITVDEIPDYSGLIYYIDNYSKKFKIIKEAPFIHKNKFNFESTLCKKFYNYWLDAKFKIHELNWKIDDLKKENNRLNKYVNDNFKK